MKSHARVVVIGGGVVGCSVLYHLTKLGWKDVVLCERKELTAGSSWHAAGGFHSLNSDPNVAALHTYTINLYREIQELSGQDIGMHLTGGLNIAATPERWDFLRADWARHRVLGLETQLMSPSQVKELCPIVDITNVYGAIYDPMEGHLDPAGTTHAYAKAARLQGAEIYRHTKVNQIAPTGRGTWSVLTDKGTIEAEHVVNAGGLWARQIGEMVGVHLPVVAMEHHYLITDDIPDFKGREKEIPMVVDLDGGIYMRQEKKGILLGVYEKEATPWAVNGAPWDYGDNELLPPNLERITDALEQGFSRFPVLSTVGIRRVVNGPFTFSPDGNPLVGPVPGLKNYWTACGVMAGFAQGGGVGLALAQWIIQGETETDIHAMDVARFGPYAIKSYSIQRAREFYARRFRIAYPNEYWPAGRPTKSSPVHGTLKSMGAVFGVSYALETPLYFARTKEETTEYPSLRRSNAFPAVAEECRAAREGVAIYDSSGFSKYLIEGPAAEERLQQLLAGRLPTSGRIRLAPMLAPSGRLMGDLTAMRLADDRFMLFGSGYLQAWHMRWFDEHLAGPGVSVRNVTDEYGGLALFGPQSRQLLARVMNGDVSNVGLPFMSVRETDVGFAPAILGRLSLSGELGFEIYVPAPYLNGLLLQLHEAADGLDARYVGMYAMNSLRLEKSFGIWSREYSRDYTPTMARLERFIDYDRHNFIGRDAVMRGRDITPKHRLVTLSMDSQDADPSGYEPVLCGKDLVGYVTSGAYGHCAKSTLAMGYLRSEIPDTQGDLTITVLGTQHAASVLTRAAVDPSGSRMRA